MRLLTLILAVSCSLTLTLRCGAGPSTQPTTSPSKPVNQFCPIDRENKIDPKVTWTYKDKSIGFCCADCIPVFKKDPEKHMQGLK
jgi:hypothetical protein